MECHDIQQKLEAFVDGELTPAEGDAIVRHMEWCRDCRAEFEKLTEADRLVAQTQGLDPGEEAWARIRAGIRKGISERPAAARPGVMDWIGWLLSPRYAVVKVGAALAIIALAFVVSRQFSVHRFSRSTETVPESVVSRRTMPRQGAPGMQKSDEVFVPQSDMSRQEGTVSGLPQLQDTVTARLDKGARPVAESQAVRLQPSEAPIESPLRDQRTVVVSGQDSLQRISPPVLEGQNVLSNEPVTPPEQAAPPGPVIETEQASESKAVSKRSIEVLSGGTTAEKGVISDRAGPPAVIREAERTEEIPALGVDETHVLGGAPVSENLEISAPVRGTTESLANEPFSDRSYWETYGVTLDASVEAKTGLDSLWAEYKRCAGDRCQQEVLPYLVEALYFEASKKRSHDDVNLAKRYMTLHREVLRNAWGDQRYNVRLQELLTLENQ